MRLREGVRSLAVAAAHLATAVKSSIDGQPAVAARLKLVTGLIGICTCIKLAEEERVETEAWQDGGDAGLDG